MDAHLIVTQLLEDRHVIGIYGENRFHPGRVDYIDMASFDLKPEGIAQQAAFGVKPDGKPGNAIWGQPGHYSSFTVVYSDGTEKMISPDELVVEFPFLRRHFNRVKQRDYEPV